MWIKPNFGGVQTLYDEGGRTGGVALRLNENVLQGNIAFNFTPYQGFSIPLPLDNDWHQVGFVFQNGVFALILDGVVGIRGVLPVSNEIVIPNPNLSISGLGCVFGDDAFGNLQFQGTSRYSGLMDNVAIFDEALTPQQILDSHTDDGDRSGLPAGDYQVFVLDLNGCTDSITLTLTQPDSLALDAVISDVSCNGDSDGSLDLIINGGTAPFTQEWSTMETTELISGLAIGAYTVTVTDANGCTVEDIFTVNEPAVLTSSARIVSNYACLLYTSDAADE